MSGLRLLGDSQAKIPLPHHWQTFDYLEGIMRGGTARQWEIKFNNRTDVYSNIRVFPNPNMQVPLEIESCTSIPLKNIQRFQRPVEIMSLQREEKQIDDNTQTVNQRWIPSVPG